MVTAAEVGDDQNELRRQDVLEMPLGSPRRCAAVPLTERCELDSKAVKDVFKVTQDEVVSRVTQSVAINFRDSEMSDLLGDVAGQWLA